MWQICALMRWWEGAVGLGGRNALKFIILLVIWGELWIVLPSKSELLLLGDQTKKNRRKTWNTRNNKEVLRQTEFLQLIRTRETDKEDKENHEANSTEQQETLLNTEIFGTIEPFRLSRKSNVQLFVNMHLGLNRERVVRQFRFTPMHIYQFMSHLSQNKIHLDSIHRSNVWSMQTTLCNTVPCIQYCYTFLIFA